VALEEADWEEEMSLFRKRLQKPNQLETMRKIVEEVDIGKVCFLAWDLSFPTPHMCKSRYQPLNCLSKRRCC